MSDTESNTGVNGNVDVQMRAVRMNFLFSLFYHFPSHPPTLIDSVQLACFEVAMLCWQAITNDSHIKRIAIETNVEHRQIKHIHSLVFGQKIELSTLVEGVDSNVTSKPATTQVRSKRYIADESDEMFFKWGFLCFFEFESFMQIFYAMQIDTMPAMKSTRSTIMAPLTTTTEKTEKTCWTKVVTFNQLPVHRYRIRTTSTVIISSSITLILANSWTQRQMCRPTIWNMPPVAFSASSEFNWRGRMHT